MFFIGFMFICNIREMQMSDTALMSSICDDFRDTHRENTQRVLRPEIMNQNNNIILYFLLHYIILFVV